MAANSMGDVGEYLPLQKLKVSTTADIDRRFTKSPTVTINVGKTPPVQYFLHKDLLTSKGPTFFAGALRSEFIEAQSLKIDLPEEDPAAFVLFV